MNSTPPSSRAFLIESRVLKEANLPNLNTYDKLMRYQTNFNNQLSKQIGELLELEKRYAK